MKGGITGLLSQKVKEVTGVPVLEILKSTHSKQRQAQLQGIERFQNPIRYGLNKALNLPKSILLVDDFMTTGHTLRSAALQIKKQSNVRIHVFCLGIRVSHFRIEPHQLPNLGHGI